MTNSENQKPVLLGGMQAHTRDLFNKGIGSEGVCSTAATTAAKEVELGTTFQMVSRATILVKFTNAISSANTTLAVTHTDLDGNTVVEDAKPIYYQGAALEAGLVEAGSILILRYDGTSWNILGTLGQDISGKANKSEMSVTPGTGADADKTTIQLKNGTSATVLTQHQDISGKADASALSSHTGDSDIHVTSQKKSDWDAKYDKPNGGIPKSDLASSVQASLDKADSALQEHQDISGKADKSATVSDVTYDSSTGKLKKTINGTTTNVCDVVTSGFKMEYSSTTGIKALTPVGGATGAFNDSTGIKAITF